MATEGLAVLCWVCSASGNQTQEDLALGYTGRQQKDVPAACVARSVERHQGHRVIVIQQPPNSGAEEGAWSCANQGRIMRSLPLDRRNRIADF